MEYKTPKELNEMLAIMREQEWAKKSDGHWARLVGFHSRVVSIRENEETRKKISEYQKNRWKNNDYDDKMKPIITPFGEFKSIGEYERTTGFQYFTKTKQMPHLYYYKGSSPGTQTYENVYLTPHGEFKTKKSAYTTALELNDVYCRSERGKDGIFSNFDYWWIAVTKKYPELFYVKKMVRRDWDYEEYKKNNP